MATAPDTFLSRSIMVLCMGTSAILLGTFLFPSSWISQSAHPRSVMANRPQPEVAVVDPTLIQSSTEVLATSLVVDLGQRQVSVIRHDQSLASYPIAVGQEGWETPIGKFRVVKKIAHPDWVHPITHEVFPPGEGNPLGSRWIGFWSDAHMEYGFHGTDEDELIGQAVSHGCIRMKNRDIEAMYAQVAVGTPIVIQP